MGYIIAMMISFVLALIAGMYTTVDILDTQPGFVRNLIKERCTEAKQFSDSGICIPEQPFVAVVRNGDWSVTLVWDDEKIKDLKTSPIK